MGHFAPRAMNQRALPSVVLSVLIVCFFAVALFQPDPSRPVRTGPRSRPGEATSRSGVASQSGPDRAFSERSEATDRLDNSSTSSTVASGPSRGSSPESREGTAPLRVAAGKDVPKLRDGRSPLEPDSGSPSARAGGASARSDRGASGLARTPAPARGAQRSVPAREPRCAFTVARADETIEDIALRVYGRSDRAGSLWRANRDTLVHPDSPISPGMLLRTPTVR
jgi:hypothetical protein